MLFKQTNRTDPEQVFVVCRNTSGGSLSAGVPVFMEVDAITDGNAVSQAGATTEFELFVGVTDSAMSDDDYGLIQVYGYRQSAYVSGASAGCAAGVPLLPVAGQNYLTDTTSSATGQWNHVHLMETIAAAAAGSTVLQYNVFIRAL